MGAKKITVTPAMIAAAQSIVADAMLEASYPCPPSEKQVAADVYIAMETARRGLVRPVRAHSSATRARRSTRSEGAK